MEKPRRFIDKEESLDDYLESLDDEQLDFVIRFTERMAHIYSVFDEAGCMPSGEG